MTNAEIWTMLAHITFYLILGIMGIVVSTFVIALGADVFSRRKLKLGRIAHGMMFVFGMVMMVTFIREGGLKLGWNTEVATLVALVITLLVGSALAIFFSYETRDERYQRHLEEMELHD